MKAFSALRIHESPAGAARPVRAVLEPLTADDLSPGDVVIRVEWSGINYKDALAATGAGRRSCGAMPLVGGIDLAGEVVSSTVARYVRRRRGARHRLRAVGDARRRLRASRARPAGRGRAPAAGTSPLEDAMVLGTAGFTAALAVMRLEHNGLAPAQAHRSS
jgi:acrylyl-CoA reductase (NADPH)